LETLPPFVSQLSAGTPFRSVDVNAGAGTIAAAAARVVVFDGAAAVTFDVLVPVRSC
jgi:hypothetical protein